MSTPEKNNSIPDYLETNKDAFQQTLFDLLEIPSVSAQPEHAADCQAAADWLVAYFQRMQFTARLLPTASHPLVLAESPKVEGAPTVLVYGHYDVQPVETGGEDSQQWLTDPFAPVVKDGCVHARGASDDKGPLLALMLSAEYWARQSRKLPLNWKFLVEGDEESSGGTLEDFVRENAEMLACDYLVLSDTIQFSPGQPAITCGLRGNVYYELRLRGPDRDLHSGMFGGAVTNPCNALTQMLAAMTDEHHRVTVPGFYDDVPRIDQELHDQLETLPFEEADFYASVGTQGGVGEEGFSVLERRWLRPSFDIHGLWGGYQAAGSKTVLPDSAFAKFSFRLVGKQDPEKITAALETFLKERCPAGIRMELVTFGKGAGAVTIDTSSPCMQAAVTAVEFGFGRSPVFIYEGGSIPVVSTFAECLTPNIMMIALSQGSDNAHGPNEHFSLTDFHRGIKTGVRLWREIAGL